MIGTMIMSEKSLIGRTIEKDIVESIWTFAEAYNATFGKMGQSELREELYQNLRRLTYETKIFGETAKDAFGKDFLENYEKYNEAFITRSGVYNLIYTLQHVRVPKEKLYEVLQAVGVEVV